MSTKLCSTTRPIKRDGAEYDEVSWDGWVQEKQAKPVPGAVAFARVASARGVTMLYLINRAEHLGPPTLENLRAVGLPVKDESVFLGLGTRVEGCERKASEKRCRRQLAGRRYRILMQFGDQLGDFAAIDVNTSEARAALQARHAGWFGQALVDAAQSDLRLLEAGAAQQRLKSAAARPDGRSSAKRWTPRTAGNPDNRRSDQLIRFIEINAI
jgi:5'-nucleotidase (lipoprotein e(P4) family)